MMRLLAGTDLRPRRLQLRPQLSLVSMVKSPTRGSEISSAPTDFGSMARPLGVSLLNPSWVRSAWK